MKYRNIFFKLLLLLVFLNGLVSCKKYLDKKPDNTLATPETLSDLQALLDHRFMYNRQTGALPETSSDDYFISQNTFDARQPVTQRAYLWQWDRYDQDNDWKNDYIPVYYANLCLEVIGTIPKTVANASQWDNVKGSALFYRSYYFFDLSSTYSKAWDKNTANTDPGIALRLGTDFNVPTTRASVRQCFDRIINDTKESLLYLPDIGQHPVRPSKAAAHGLLARVYLSMLEYDSAAKYADLSLQIKSDLINYNSTLCTTCDITASFNVSAYPFRPFNSETVFYTEMNLYYGLVSSITRAIIDTALYDLYATTDLRKKAFFTPSTASPSPPGRTYYRFKGSYTQSNVLFTGITTSEMWLIRAECLARDKPGANANVPAAMNALNTLLMKRYVTGFAGDSASTKEEALRKILTERRKELLMRGLRWQDVKRLNKENAGIVLTRRMNGQIYSLLPNDDRYALPIPQEIIDITGIRQNQGW